MDEDSSESRITRPWPLALVALAIATIAWLAWPQAAPGPLPSGSASPAGDPGADARSAALDPATAGDEPAVRSEVGPPAGMGGERTATFPNDESLGLLVIDGDTRQPIANADVWFATLTDRDDTLSFDESLERNELGYADVEAYLRRHGRARRTDHEGRCRIHSVGWVRVAARSGERYGETFTSEDTEREHVLPLFADRTLTVEVLDATGRPAAGVDVVRWTERADGSRVRERIGETGEDGRLVRPHAQTLRPPEGAAGIDLAAAPLGGTTPAQRVDVSAPPRAPIVFRLPPTGSLTLRVVDRDGAPWAAAPFQASARRVTLHLEGDAEPDWSTWLDRQATTRFAHVVLDRRFVATFDQLQPTAKPFAGPTSARPDLAVDLRLDPNAVSVAGRAVDGDARPHAGRKLQFNFVHETVHVGTLVETGENGGFEAVLPGIPAGSRPKLEMFLWPQQIDGPRPHLAVVPERALVAGRNDLGDVTLDPGELVGSGTVCDQDGQPLDDVGLAVEHATAGDWEYVQLEVVVADGRLEIRGDTPPGRLRIRRGDIRYLLDTPVEFVAGATDIDVRMIVCGSIPFALGVDETTAWTDVDLILASRDATNVGFLRPLKPDDQGEVHGRWDGVPPGAYRVEVRLAHAADPIATVADVVVAPGRETNDPRLHPLDVTGLARRVHLRVRSATGESVGGAIALAPDPLGDAWCAFEPGPDGRIAIPVRAALERVEVLAYGHLPTTLRALDSDRNVALEPSAPFVVRFEPEIPWPEDVTATAILAPLPPNPIASATGRGLHHEPRLAGGGYVTWPRPVSESIDAAIDAQQRATFDLRSPGAYRATLRLATPDGRSAEVEIDPSNVIDWQPGRDAHPVPLSEAQLRAALAALEG